MFNSKGRDMGIRDQVRRRLAFSQQLPKNNPMPLGRADDSRAGLIQPALDIITSLIQRQGAFIYSGISAYPDKGG